MPERKGAPRYLEGLIAAGPRDQPIARAPRRPIEVPGGWAQSLETMPPGFPAAAPPRRAPSAIDPAPPGAAPRRPLTQAPRLVDEPLHRPVTEPPPAPARRPPLMAALPTSAHEPGTPEPPRRSSRSKAPALSDATAAPYPPVTRVGPAPTPAPPAPTVSTELGARHTEESQPPRKPSPATANRRGPAGPLPTPTPPPTSALSVAERRPPQPAPQAQRSVRIGTVEVFVAAPTAPTAPAAPPASPALPVHQLAASSPRPTRAPIGQRSIYGLAQG